MLVENAAGAIKRAGKSIKPLLGKQFKMRPAQIRRMPATNQLSGKPTRGRRVPGRPRLEDDAKSS